MDIDGKDAFDTVLDRLVDAERRCADAERKVSNLDYKNRQLDTEKSRLERNVGELRAQVALLRSNMPKEILEVVDVAASGFQKDPRTGDDIPF